MNNGEMFLYKGARKMHEDPTTGEKKSTVLRLLCLGRTQDGLVAFIVDMVIVGEPQWKGKSFGVPLSEVDAPEGAEWVYESIGGMAA